MSQPGELSLAYFIISMFYLACCVLSASVRLNMVILCFLKHHKSHELQINLSSYKTTGWSLRGCVNCFTTAFENA